MEFSGYGAKKSSEDDCATNRRWEAGMPYWKLYYHLVWATYERQPSIDSVREAIIWTTLSAKAAEMRVVLHAVGNVADHIHVVASVPPALTLATCVKHLKGASSRAVNVQLHAGSPFRWQEGYGALTLGERSLDRVVSYVHDQPRHHGEGRTVALYEATDEPTRSQSSSDDFKEW